VRWVLFGIPRILRPHLSPSSHPFSLSPLMEVQRDDDSPTRYSHRTDSRPYSQNDSLLLPRQPPTFKKNQSIKSIRAHWMDGTGNCIPALSAVNHQRGLTHRMLVGSSDRRRGNQPLSICPNKLGLNSGSRRAL